MSDWEALAGEEYCYLTTTGRVSGNPHRIEIWFAIQRSTLYMLSGGGERSDWVKNLVRNPAVKVEVGDREIEARARVVDDPAEDALARRLLPEKYSPGYSGDLSNWRRTALPIAVDLPD